MRMFNERMKARGQGGFTLIELLVVIAILAVLGGAVIIGIGAMRGNAQEQVCKTEVETIETAAEAYKVSDDDGDYPTIAELVAADPVSGEFWLKEGSIDVADWTLVDGEVTGQSKYDDLGASGATLCEPT